MDNDDIIYIDATSEVTILGNTFDTTIDISNITVDTIDLDSLTITNTDTIFSDYTTPVEFEDKMPDVAKVEDMCNDYPALAKAYENFKTIYKMVHQDWKGRQEQDDQLPF